MNNGEMVPNIHVGKMIERRLSEMKMSQTQFAKIMFMPQSNISRLLKRETMDIEKLVVICMKMEYNFFEEFCGRKDTRAYNGKFSIPLVNIGSSISDYLKSNNMSQIEFSEIMGIQQPDTSKLLKRASLDTGKLTLISNNLHHNFFEEYCTVSQEIPQTAAEEDKTPTTEFQELLSRYENLTVENVTLKARIYELEQKLLAAGIQL